MILSLPVLEPVKIEPIAIVRQAEEKPKPPTDKTYTIKKGDTLTSISKAHKVPLQRLWAKNRTLSDPDKLSVNKTLKIPQDSEKLKARPFPAKVKVSTKVGSLVKAEKPSSGGFSVSGNTYTYGFCTWYVKNMRPDIPNGLGNADTWYYRYNGAKGDTPAVGAVAVAKNYMHVALVVGITGATVQIREMNYQGWNVVSSRTTSASEFRYIY